MAVEELELAQAELVALRQDKRSARARLLALQDELGELKRSHASLAHGLAAVESTRRDAAAAASLPATLSAEVADDFVRAARGAAAAADAVAKEAVAELRAATSETASYRAGLAAADVENRTILARLGFERDTASALRREVSDLRAVLAAESTATASAAISQAEALLEARRESAAERAGRLGAEDRSVAAARAAEDSAADADEARAAVAESYVIHCRCYDYAPICYATPARTSLLSSH